MTLSRHEERHWRVCGQDRHANGHSSYWYGTGSTCKRALILFSRGILYLHRPSGIWYHVECLHRPASQRSGPKCKGLLLPSNISSLSFWHHKLRGSALWKTDDGWSETCVNCSRDILRHLSCYEDTCITADGFTFRPGMSIFLMVLCCRMECLRQYGAVLPAMIATTHIAGKKTANHLDAWKDVRSSDSSAPPSPTALSRDRAQNPLNPPPPPGYALMAKVWKCCKMSSR